MPMMVLCKAGVSFFGEPNRLYPTATERVALEAQLAFACDLYNAAIEQRRAWRLRRRAGNYAAQCRGLTHIPGPAMGPPPRAGLQRAPGSPPPGRPRGRTA